MRQKGVPDYYGKQLGRRFQQLMLVGFLIDPYVPARQGHQPVDIGLIQSTSYISDSFKVSFYWTYSDLATADWTNLKPHFDNNTETLTKENFLEKCAEGVIIPLLQHKIVYTSHWFISFSRYF